MFTKIRKSIAIISASVMLAIVPAAALSTAVYADAIGDCLTQGSDLTTGTGAGCAPSGGATTGTDRIQSLVTTIINVFSIIVGIVAVIMIIVGGFKYITSGGDSGNITGAKNTIVYAVIGLVVVALAQFVVKFVLEKVNTP